MKSNTLISIIIPVYNVEQYLCKCIDSILVQTYKNIEIILVDDGSTDSSPSLCDNYAKKDTRIKIVHQTNAGVSAARNKALQIAHGEYISFIDSDDWVAPSFIETLLNTARKYDAPVSVVGRYNMFPSKVQHRHMQINPNKEKVFSTSEAHFNSQQALELFTFSFDVCVTSKLFHASVFKQVQFPVGLTFEDSWILYRLFQGVNKVAVYNVPLYYYNLQNESSLSKGKFRLSMLDYFKVTDEFMAEAKTFKTTKILRKLQRDRISHICGFFKRMMLSNYNDQKVIKPLQQELRRNLWLLIVKPYPALSVSVFGVACAISFRLTKKLFLGIKRIWTI